MAANIGFIGLGNMGRRLASNLSEQQTPVAVWDRNMAGRSKGLSDNLKPHPTIADVVRYADFIFLSLADDTAVREVISEAAGEDLSGKILCDFSTIAPQTSAELAALVHDRGGSMLDAAVSGSTPQVEARSLTIFVGGPNETFRTVQSLIEPLGRATYYMGVNGNGLKMKLCVNLLLGTGLAALAESLTLAQKMGLSKTRAVEALAGTAVMSPSQTSKLELAINNDYAHATFALYLMQKDLSLVLDEARHLGIDLALAAAADDLAKRGLADAGDQDFAVMISICEHSAGIGGEVKDDRK